MKIICLRSLLIVGIAVGYLCGSESDTVPMAKVGFPGQLNASDVSKVHIKFCDLLRRRSSRLGAACAVAEWGVRGAIKLAEAYELHDLAEAIRRYFGAPKEKDEDEGKGRK
jgi:hypothetical protein